MKEPFTMHEAGDCRRELANSAKVIRFPHRPTEELGWVCGCGSFNWILYANGDCLCVGCNCISTVIKVVRDAHNGEGNE